MTNKDLKVGVQFRLPGKALVTVTSVSDDAWSNETHIYLNSLSPTYRDPPNMKVKGQRYQLYTSIGNVMLYSKWSPLSQLTIEITPEPV